MAALGSPRLRAGEHVPRRQRARTATIREVEVDFRVLRFTSHDSSFLSSIGKHCHESRWLIEVGGTPQPIDICVNVDKQVLSAPEISVTCNGSRVLPAAGSGATRQKLKEDFVWRWPFRGLVRGIGTPQHFEVRPEGLRDGVWYPATVTEQLDDGNFKATVFMPDGTSGQIRGFDFPMVSAKILREAGGLKTPVTIPSCSLVLKLPAHDPLHSTIYVERDGESDPELITHFFARRTPAPPKGIDRGPAATDPRVKMEVTQDRQLVKCNVGPLTLKHFLSGEVRAVTRETSSNKLMTTWVVEVGPFARHTIQVEKTKASSKVVTLTIDGDVLCEATAEDIDCDDDEPEERERPAGVACSPGALLPGGGGPSGPWECGFRLFGQRYLDWLVYETNTDGVAQANTGEVSQRTGFVHECRVAFRDSVALAELTIDGKEFKTLPEHLRQKGTAERPLECSPEALLGSFGLVTPYKVDPNAPASGFNLPPDVQASLKAAGDALTTAADQWNKQTDQWNKQIVEAADPLKKQFTGFITSLFTTDPKAAASAAEAQAAAASASGLASI